MSTAVMVPDLMLFECFPAACSIRYTFQICFSPTAAAHQWTMEMHVQRHLCINMHNKCDLLILATSAKISVSWLKVDEMSGKINLKARQSAFPHHLAVPMLLMNVIVHVGLRHTCWCYCHPEVALRIWEAVSRAPVSQFRAVENWGGRGAKNYLSFLI